MGVAHSLPRHERIGLSEPVRIRREKTEKTEKRSSPRKKKIRKKVTRQGSRKTSPIKKKRKRK